METILIGTLFFLPAFLGNAAAMCAGPLARLGKPFSLTFDEVISRGRVYLFGSHKRVLGCAIAVLAALAAGENILALHIQWGIVPAVFSPETPWKDAMVTPLLLGVGVCVGDLAGSFLKRLLRYKPGEDLWGVDQADWFLGALAVLFLFDRLPSWDVVLWGGIVLLVARFAAEVPRRKLFCKQ